MVGLVGMVSVVGVVGVVSMVMVGIGAYRLAERQMGLTDTCQACSRSICALQSW